MTGIGKWARVAVLDFPIKGNSYYFLNGVNASSDGTGVPP